MTEEKKDEIKNRISMALKDPILQQGFEIICKEIAELEQKLEQTEKDLADYQFNYPSIKELSKENAELKAELKAIDKAGEHARKQITESFRNKKPYYELEQENNKLLDIINNQDVKIADLEKKVKYYEQQLSAMEKGVCDVCKVKDADYYEKQIADLEKKLKESEHNKKTVVHLSDCVSDIQDKQIEQAKEIIRKMLFALSDNRVSFLTNPYYDLEKQAEQFIGEKK